jgi:hypothetical protein
LTKLLTGAGRVGGGNERAPGRELLVDEVTLRNRESSSGTIRSVSRWRLGPFHCGDIIGGGGPDGGPGDPVQETDELLLLAFGESDREFPRSPQAPEEVNAQVMFPR